MIDVRKILLTITVLLLTNFLLVGQTPLASGKIKFLGNVYSGSQAVDFNQYWNQVTAENAGKWGSVEGTRDVMNFGELDAASGLAQTNSFVYKHHVLIWGSQQPAWIESLSPADQLEEIKEWFSAVAVRYPNLGIIEVVNEPLHAPPNQTGGGRGNYINALGGNGTTGWDWVLTSFRMAREYFPNAKLMLNDYNIINQTSSTQAYLQIINLLLKEHLIDQIGIQGHAFTINDLSPATIKTNLDLLAATGLPIYVTELDIDGATESTSGGVTTYTRNDALQATRYQNVFPAFWTHPSVNGITLWGWRPGLWRNNQMAYLIDPSGVKRSAFTWLENYVKTSSSILATSISLTTSTGSTVISTIGGRLKVIGSVAPGVATLKVFDWSVSDNAIAKINSGGELLAVADGKVTVTATARDGSGVTGTIEILIVGQNGIVTASEKQENLTVRSYPNPVINGQFTIEGTQKIQRIMVQDMHGKNVHDMSILNQPTVQINLNNPTPGVYAVQLYDGQKFMVKKILVK
jgi:endo-1,4-beta-xylanase